MWVLAFELEQLVKVTVQPVFNILLMVNAVTG
jgi:hypothetical protein